jgi:hypothetical protein
MNHTAPAPAWPSARRARVPDTTPAVPVALALLDRYWPDTAPPDAAASADALAALASDRRYLIERFQQALSVLLAADLPPMDPLTSLLSRALDDAMAWREHRGRPCTRCAGTDDTLCPACAADCDLVDRYHALARSLGAVGDPAPPSS